MKYNKQFVGGNLVKDIDFKTTQSGVNIAKFTVGWSRKYKDKEDRVFFDCVAFGKTAEMIAKNFQKGSGIFVEGTTITQTWEKDGKKNYKNVIEVSNVTFTDFNSEPKRAAKTDDKPIDPDDDIPF